MIVWEILLLVGLAALILQFFDASTGMGFGEIIAFLLILGFAPLEAVPAVILSGVVLSSMAGFLHHGFKNVDFSLDSQDLKAVLVLISFGVFGISLGALIATWLPDIFLKAYISILVIVVGIIILLKKIKKEELSWKKLGLVGFLASLNKGLAGAGFGPILSGGQIISGVETKKAVGMTEMTEGIVSIMGVFTYVALNGRTVLNWHLIFSLIVGGLMANVLGVYAVKKVKERLLKIIIGIICLILGLGMFIKLFLEIMA